MNNITGFELLCVIVKCGMGSKIMSCAKENGITGGTVFLGKGTVRNPILEFLELAEVRREIVLMAAEKEKANVAVEALNKKFKLHKPNHGIAFTMSVSKILGTHCIDCDNVEKESRGVENPMYNLIFVIVDRGKGELVVEAANKAGSRGATIVNARGSGIHETNKLFNMEIEPEKEVVLLLSPENLTDSIASRVKEDLEIDKPGNGIIFIQDVNKTYGLY